ncbi:type I polyketide synthase [Actinomadura sp. SCN-SB]|uniref:type I polyketide synthase n=1 Tax=Actinomadura sp. SCN-SB TaxID=3373092 RepID=UPI003750F9F7
MSTEAPQGVAVIGLAGRFPMAPDAAALWQNLCEGRDCLETLDDAELRAEGVPESALRDPAYVRRAGTLAGYDEFDAEFFGLPRRLAEQMDPQQRLFLQCCWHALEDAGYDPARYPGPIGVFGSGSFGGYFPYHVLSQYDLRDLYGSGNSQLAQLLSLSDPNFLATRVAHALDLHGPAMSVQTACSSALVAVHMAAQSLLCGESDMALAGGMTVRIPPRAGYLSDAESTISPDGYCRPFDAGANGTVFTSGGGVVLLKRLADATADGDHVRAVIRGSAVNNDGSLKMGYAAPSVEMQAEVVAEAIAVADIEPATVSYVEAHGTGTALGDPVEVAALSRAFGTRQTCAIGSVKGNIGHCEVAAGIAGLIKTVLALEHRTLVPTAHYTEPNPELHLADTPFYVQDQLTGWESDGPRRAGVSSLGVGGTNVHVVVEEAPVPTAAAAAPPTTQALVLSARTPDALAESGRSFARHLREQPDTDLANVAFTLAEGRHAFPCRRAVVASSAEQAADAFDTELAESEPVGEAPGAVLLFPGLGTQYPRVAEGLHREEPTFAEHFDRCAELFSERLGTDLRSTVFSADETWTHRTDLTQAALFTVEYAMARTLEAYGVHPVALVGQGIGEYAAACVAGVFDLTEAVRISHDGVDGSPAQLGTPRIPLLSAASGTWLSDVEARVLIETGPGRELISAAEGSHAWSSGHRAMPTLGRGDGPDGELADFLSALGTLWTAGIEVDWSRARHDRPVRRVPLPGYPFSRTRHWLDSRYAADDDPRPTAVRAVEGPDEPVDRLLTGLLSRAFGVEVGVDDDFRELGGDSVTAAQIAARARSHGLRFRPRDLLDHPTASALAKVVDKDTTIQDAPVAVSEAQATGPPERTPLTPMQLELMSPMDPARAFDAPMVFELGSEVDHEMVVAALTHVRAHHDALQQHFVEQGGIWEQRAIEMPSQVEVPVVPLHDNADPGDALADAATLAGLVHEHLAAAGDTGSPLLAALFEGPSDGQRRLAVVTHSAITDRTARRILAEDLTAACRQLLMGRPVDLPPVATPWHGWSEYVTSLAHDPEAQAEREFWLDTLGRADAAAALPSSDPAEHNGRRSGDARMATTVIDPAVTSALRAVHKSEQVGMGELVLAALASVYARVAGGETALLDIVGSARKADLAGIDLRRTLGCCSTVFPVVVTPSDSPHKTLPGVRDTLREIPRQGLGYGVLRHLHGPTALAMREFPAADTVFADLGAMSTGTESAPGPALAELPSGAPIGGPPLALGHLLDVRCYRQNRRLHIDWWYDGDRLADDLIADLRARTQEALTALASTGDQDLRQRPQAHQQT